MELTEQSFVQVAGETFAAVIQAFDEIDSDDADLDVSGDVISIRFRDGTRAVLNTQRPTRQLWLAGGASAWHFDRDEARGLWVDAKGTEAELLSTLAAIAREHAGVELRFEGAR